jgi:hypothetical protein
MNSVGTKYSLWASYSNPASLSIFKNHQGRLRHLEQKAEIKVIGKSDTFRDYAAVETIDIN